MPPLTPDSAKLRGDSAGAPPRAARAAARSAALLPPSAVLAVRLAAPDLPPSKLRRILPSLLASELPFPADACVWRFERSGGAVLAHVARRTDVAAFLDSLRVSPADPGPRHLVPPGPLAWRRVCAEHPLPDGAPRAAILLCGGPQGVLAAGRGDALESVVVFQSSDPADAAKRLRMALGADAARASVAVAGPGAAAFAASLPAGLSAFAVAAPETFADRALAVRSAVEALDLRAPAADAGAVAPHPLQGRARARAAVAAASAVLAVCSFFCAFGKMSASGAASALEGARAARREAVDGLAGYRVSARGEAAVREAAAAAAARRDPALRLPDASEAVSAVASAARASNVRLSHLELRAGAVAASGTAPDSASAQGFAEGLAARGLRAVMAEPPKAAPSGGVSFFIQPSGGGVP